MSGRERPEVLYYDCAGLLNIDIVRALAGRSLGEHALRILPEPELLEPVLELYTEPAAENR